MGESPDRAVLLAAVPAGRPRRWFGGGYAISEPLRPEHFEDETLPMDAPAPETDDASP